MVLTDRDRAMLNGEHGPAPQLAMSILVRMAAVYGATELMDISHAHIDSTIYLGDATLEFAERLAALGARVAVPTTLNVSGVDECGWREWAVSPEWAAKAARQMLAYEKMGAAPTWTCAPYQTQARPVFGQQIAWGESNAIAFANSVIGARTERYPDLLDICCAITGRVAAVGLHMTENRAGQLLLRLVDVPVALQQDGQFFAVLGHLVGKLAGDLVPVIDGIRVSPAEDDLKAFAAAVASSGCVALFHLVGVTPEAATLEAAFQNRQPRRTVDVSAADLRAARGELTHIDVKSKALYIDGMKSTISAKGQITVPVEIRDKLGLAPGTVVRFDLREGGVLLRKGGSGAHPVDQVFGRLRLTKPVDVLLDTIQPYPTFSEAIFLALRELDDALAS